MEGKIGGQVEGGARRARGMHGRNGQQQRQGTQKQAEGEGDRNEAQGEEDEENEGKRGEAKMARRATATRGKIERMGNDSAIA